MSTFQVYMVSIDYDDDGYKGVTVKAGGSMKAAFMSGCPAVDWFRMLRWWILHEVRPDRTLVNRSSVDHFVMDTPGYRWEEVEEASVFVLLEDGQTIDCVRAMARTFDDFPAYKEQEVGA